MNLDRIKPEQLAAGVMDLTPSQSLAAHEYAERLNAALARLGLTDRLTLPPAPNTAIDELPGVVDVPLRKTLSVLMGKAEQGDASALATLEWTAQVAESIFAGLHARASVYPLALPSDESLATLSQGVDALLPRKISNGAWSLMADGTPSDGIDDGMSLVRLFCTDAIDSVTELKDDNEGWVANVKDGLNALVKQMINVRTITMNCVEITQSQLHDLYTPNETYHIYFPFLSGVSQVNIIGQHYLERDPAYIVYAPSIKTTNFISNGYTPFYAREIYMPNYEQGVYLLGGSGTYSNIHTTRLLIGCNGKKETLTRIWTFLGSTTLTDLEIGEGACQNITIQNINGLTADNMYNHILCRLKQDEPMCGEGVTITLGTTNIDKIEAIEEYNLKLTELTDIYGYTFA